jgi:ribosome-binding protein aMBF1 (putative translation factor)
MSERRKPLSYEHEETIAAFDREREEAHELRRRYHEIISNARRNDRIVGHDRHPRDR